MSENRIERIVQIALQHPEIVSKLSEILQLERYLIGGAGAIIDVDKQTSRMESDEYQKIYHKYDELCKEVVRIIVKETNEDPDELGQWLGYNYEEILEEYQKKRTSSGMEKFIVMIREGVRREPLFFIRAFWPFIVSVILLWEAGLIVKQIQLSEPLAVLWYTLKFLLGFLAVWFCGYNTLVDPHKLPRPVEGFVLLVIIVGAIVEGIFGRSAQSALGGRLVVDLLVWVEY